MIGRVRKGPLLASMAIHGCIIALFFATTTTERSHRVTRELSVFNISALAAAPKAQPKVPQAKRIPPTPPQPVIVPPPIVPLPTPNEAVVALLDQADVSAAGGACDLTEPVRAALQASKEVLTSLPQIPRDKRSVANAIMVWKVAWLAEDGELDTAAVAMIRDVVAGTIAAATPECRLQPQIGPRLLLLSGTGDTVVLAVGSGAWRWQDLLETARPDWAEEDLLGGAQPQTIIASMDRASIARR
jgi:hypothetical protein